MDPAVQHTNDSVILAAGGLILREASTEEQVLIVHRKRYGDWSLPKGKLNEGESYETAALREVKEETGCICELGEYVGAIGYKANGAPKVVLFWRMTVKEQGPIQDLDESKEARWLSIPDALERLSYPQEKSLLSQLYPQKRTTLVSRLLRLSGKRLSSEPIVMRSSWGNRWFYGKLERDRLARETEVFQTELEFLETRNGASNTSWALAANKLLSNTKNYLGRGDSESGWVCLHAAQRYAIFGFTEEELANRASALRYEAEAGKITGWRVNAMKDLLKEDRITQNRIFDATAMRDEHSSNQYYKIWLTKDQFRVLLLVCIPAFLSLILLSLLSPHTLSEFTPTEAWKFQTVLTVLIFGLLGASFSVAQSLMADSRTARIPERVASHYVTLMRLLCGSIVGLASYAFLVSKVFSIKGLEDNISAAFTFAFLFGYTGERLVVRVAGAAANAKSKN
jgi:8-oxo-dGTP diphosphatase